MVGELFQAYLSQHDDASWLRVIDRIESSIHPVDRAATRIWFQLYPLALDEAMARPDAADLARRMTLAGRWRLADHVDRSHAFLFGHRYWREARQAVLDHAAGPRAPGRMDLGAQILDVARRVSAQVQQDAPVVTGITAVAMRTLQQAGNALSADAPPDSAAIPVGQGTADRALAARQRPASRALFGWLRGPRQSRVTFNENDPTKSFSLVDSQHLTTAAALDRRDYRLADPRCAEGPIPVQCRSCSCGTCWVGILSDPTQLSPMDGRERQKLAEIGITSEGPHPSMRLACMTQAFADVSIVIPPWNGLVGRVLKTFA